VYVCLKTCLKTSCAPIDDMTVASYTPFIFRKTHTKKSYCRKETALCRRPAAVLLGLKFAETFTTSLIVAKLRKPGFREFQTYRRKTEFNTKWPFKVTQGHVFWSQWKGDKGLNNTAPATFRLRKIRSPSADPKYSADHVPLPHISAGDIIKQKYSKNSLYSKYVK